MSRVHVFEKVLPGQFFALHNYTIYRNIYACAEPILMQFIANSLSSALIVIHVTTRHFWCAKRTWEQYQVQV